MCWCQVVCLPKPGEEWAVGLQVIRLIAGSVKSVLKGSLDSSVLSSGAELLNLAIGKAQQLLQRDMDKLFKLLAQFSHGFNPDDIFKNQDEIKDDVRYVPCSFAFSFHPHSDLSNVPRFHAFMLSCSHALMHFLFSRAMRHSDPLFHRLEFSQAPCGSMSWDYSVGT